MLGPIDYVALGFRGNNFNGSIINELANAVRDGVIRVIDLVFIMKNEDGSVAGGEYEDQPDELKAMLKDVPVGNDLPLLTEDDIQKLGTNMEPDTAAGVLVIEHLWAKDLKRAIIDAGGFLIADGRIHPEKVAAALEDLKQSKKEA